MWVLDMIYWFLDQIYEIVIEFLMNFQKVVATLKNVKDEAWVKVFRKFVLIIYGHFALNNYYYRLLKLFVILSYFTN
jgi:hypothetical protein